MLYAAIFRYTSKVYYDTLTHGGGLSPHPSSARKPGLARRQTTDVNGYTGAATQTIEPTKKNSYAIMDRRCSGKRGGISRRP